ncbi:MFS transporter [Diplocloster modestus]|uniref:MFS transporter n=1 Tax=Diplocloster modestus TaxID=2850322 RepID=A0ABS6K4X0_9FIRM|nr:MFS transporter [Diplocloster modestus]MBU9725535.1 MFS transporter [Diplocloster modestus]
MRKNDSLIAFLAFAMYFLTGAACIVVGSGLPHLVKMYDMQLDQVVLLGSAYAFGRVLTVYTTGRLVEKLGPVKVLAGGVTLIAVFLFGLPTIANYYAGLFFAALGGIGMGAQDTVCPVLLSVAFRKNYAGSLSAGQALFGLGSFATPFLVGVLLANGRFFYYAYYILLIVPVVMLICMPFVKLDMKEHVQNQEQNVKPIHVKHKLLAYGAILIICAAYSAVVNTLGLYLSSFAENIGIAQSTSAFMLTVYNVGCVIGSFVFVIVLKKIKAQIVLLVNNICALAAIGAALVINTVAAYFIGMFTAGFFLGVLFSVIVAVATRIGYERISIASSLVATASGLSDILTPVVTGFLVGRLGVGFSFKYAMIMIAVCIVAAAVLRLNTSEKQQEVQKYVDTE